MLANLFRRPVERAAGPRVPFVADNGVTFGPGAATQPDHRVLQRESRGIASAAKRAIANRIASLEPQAVVDRRISDGTVETEILDDHPMSMLLDRPHPNLTRRQVFGLSAEWIVDVGEAYWLKVDSGLRVPTELHPFPPSMIEPVVQQGVVVAYRITDGNGREFLRDPDTVVRIYFPDPENPWRSRGYLGPSAIALDAYRFASEHIRSHYQHDATPKVVMEADKEAAIPDPTTRDRIEQEWIESYHRRTAGRSQGVPRWTAPGWKAHELSGAAGEATKAYLDFFRESLLMEVGGVPPAILGRVVSGDRSSAETVQWIFDMYSVLPIALLIEDAVTMQLANDFDPKLAMRFAPFISEDKDFELKREAHDLEHAIRTPNKVLTDREDDTVPWGDKPLISGKLGPYDPNAKPQPVGSMPDEDADDEDEDAGEMAEMDERALHIAVRKLAREQRRKAKERRSAA